MDHQFTLNGNNLGFFASTYPTQNKGFRVVDDLGDVGFSNASSGGVRAFNNPSATILVLDFSRDLVGKVDVRYALDYASSDSIAGRTVATGDLEVTDEFGITRFVCHQRMLLQA